MTDEFEKKKREEYLEQAKSHIDLAQEELDGLKDAANRCDILDTILTFRNVFLHIEHSRHYIGDARPPEKTVIELGEDWDRIETGAVRALQDMPCEVKKLEPTKT
ncbi:unnamed protein product [marine sediment metagenome]|uniref:Uncharacterized protein n=1 Tax=marine sediment metagenome TaxID=412755 RepID=X1C7H4_9ZZZZ